MRTCRWAICLGVLAGSAAVAQEPIVVFVSDQTLDGVFRIEDLNLDGDTNDPGEVTLFFDETVPVTGTENSQGLYAFGPHEVYATDNFEPDNVIRLVDLDRSGDAFGPAESTVWFDGALPGGFAMTNPVCLSRGPDGALYLIDNNTLDTANPEAVYRLEDLNADGDVNDPNEVTHYFELSPVGVSAATTFDVEFDNAGAAYVIDITDPQQIESIDRIDPNAQTISEWLNSADLFNNTGFVLSGMYELTYNPATDEIICGVVNLGFDVHFMALRDRNRSGAIDALNEVRIIWGETLNADGVSSGTARDFQLFDDGSIVFVDNLTDQLVRLVDRNGDNDFNDLNETLVMYSAAQAAAAGLPSPNNLLAIAVAYASIPGDCDEDGLTGAADLDAFTLCLSGPEIAAPSGCGCADIDHDSDVDLADAAVFQLRFTGD